jgi:lipoprotein NlpI
VAAAVEAGSEAGAPVPIGVETTDPGRFDPGKLVALLAALGQPAIDRDELRPLVAACAASTDVSAINRFRPPTPSRRRCPPMRPLRTLLLAAVGFLLLGFVASPAAEPTAQELFTEAVQLFFAAKPVDSARKFDQLALAVPGAEPGLWQRGLALYYAERFQDGRQQFELHRTVNPNDVENPAWHFLCVAKLEGIEAARGKLLPVGEDLRVPMKEILEFYAGRGEAAAVLAAAEKGEGEPQKNQLCYAHLYLGLCYEAAGDAVKAREHITQAAGPFRMDHYMGKVAVMHAKLRGWPVHEPPASLPQ